MKINIVKSGVYSYWEKSTLSFTWNCRWIWIPCKYGSWKGDWFIHWGRFVIERFSYYD